MNERIKLLRKSLNLTQQEFANKIGMKRNTIANYEINRNKPSNAVISLICKEFNVNETWLRNGIGEMFNKVNTFSLDEYAKERGLTPIESDIIRDYMSLDSDVRKILIDHLKMIFNKHNTETSNELDIDQEVEDYRRELEQEKSIQTSSASHDGEKIS